MDHKLGQLSAIPKAFMPSYYDNDDALRKTLDAIKQAGTGLDPAVFWSLEPSEGGGNTITIKVIEENRTVSIPADNDKLWLSVAQARFPDLPEHELCELRFVASIDYLYDTKSDLCVLFEQYVMMRALTDPNEPEPDEF
jgi:hypothetical protein